jgi:hypothetical protein
MQVFGRAHGPRTTPEAGSARHRRGPTLAVIRVTFSCAVICASCTSATKDSPGTAPSVSVDQVTTPSSSSAPPATAPNTGNEGATTIADPCRSVIDQRLASIRTELTRLDPVPLADAVGNDGVADLSDRYYTDADELDGSAAAIGCDRPALARGVLERADELPTKGPIAASAKASIIDENAWRVARNLPPGTPPTVILNGPPIPASVTEDLSDCVAIGNGWAEVISAMTDALGGITIEDYLSLADIRSIDARDLATSNDSLGFDIPGLREAATSLTTAADELGCTDDNTAVVLLERLPALAAPSAAATVFLADQIDVALLLVLGF